MVLLAGCVTDPRDEPGALRMAAHSKVRRLLFHPFVRE